MRGTQPCESLMRHAMAGATEKDRKEPLTPHPIDPSYYAWFFGKSRQQSVKIP